MVLRPTDPAVIGDFVIVPDTDERCTRVRRLHIGIGLHLRMAPAIVVELHDLVRRIGQPVQFATDVRAITLRAIFVDIVAKVHDRVELRQGGHVGIGVEQPAGIKLARRDRDRQPVDRADRQGAEPPYRRPDAAGCAEPEPIVATGRQSRHLDLRGMIGERPGRHAARHAGLRIGRVGDMPFERDIARAVDRGGPGPQHRAIARRVAAGDAMVEPCRTRRCRL